VLEVAKYPEMHDYELTAVVQEAEVAGQATHVVRVLL